MLYHCINGLFRDVSHYSQASCFLPFSAYQVIVLKVADGFKELPDNYDSKLKAASDVKKESMNFYIAAEIQSIDKPWKFTVGDGKITEEYVNEELEKGENYIVYERALTKTQKACKLIISNIFLSLQLESSDHECGETVCLFFSKKTCNVTWIYNCFTAEEVYPKLTRALTCFH